MYGRADPRHMIAADLATIALQCEGLRIIQVTSGDNLLKTTVYELNILTADRLHTLQGAELLKECQKALVEKFAKF